MTRLAESLRALLAALAEENQPVAIVGGIAVSARTEPRFTRDIDLAAPVASDREAEALIRRLAARGLTPGTIVLQDTVGRVSTVRLVRPREGDDGIVSDLLFASSGIEGEIVAAAEVLEVFPGVTGPVARIGHLIALKLLARDDTKRPQDASDLRALLAVAGAEEIERAREAVRLIEKRGYHRDRDLAKALEELTGDSRKAR